MLVAALFLLLASGMVAGNWSGASTPEGMHTAASATSKKIVRPKARTRALLTVVNQEDIRPEHRSLADQVLRALPSSCRNALQNFYVLYGDDVKNRGLGGASTIIVSGMTKPREFMALVTHECGHVADLGGLTGSPSAGTTAFVDAGTPMFADDPSIGFYSISWKSPTELKRGAKESDFVSGYALTDTWEEFAETFAYFALQRKEFARLAARNPVLKAKYDFMEQVVFAGTPEFAVGQHTRGRRAPWDVTMLPYVWHAKE